MAFTYEQYRSPYVGTMADLLAHQNDARARAAEISGQAWGGAVANIGQTIAQIPGQIAQQRRVGLQDQVLAGQVADQQAARTGQRAVDTLMQGDQLPAGDAGPRQESYIDPNTGLFIVPKLNQALAKMGVGHMAPDLLKGAEAINASIIQHQALEQKLGEASTLMLGDMADGVSKLAAIGMPLDRAMDFVMQPALATKRITPDRYAQIKGQILALPPEQQKAALDQFMNAAAHLGGGKTLAKDAVEVDRYNRPMASNIVPDKPTEATLDADAQALLAKQARGETLTPTETSNLTAYNARKTPHTTKSLESKNVLLDGKPALVNFNPTTGAHTLPDGTDVSARVTPVPSAAQITINNRDKAPAGDFTKTGEDFLAGVPVQWRSTVKKIAFYDEDPTKVASMRGGMRETLMQWVNQVNPAYDQSQFALRSPTRKAFTIGTQGQTLNALNTAIGHLDQLTGLVDKLGNGAFTPGNRVWNSVQTIFGSDKVTNFDTLKDALAGEVAKTLSGGAATVDGIREQRTLMNAYSSPDALAGYVKTLIPTLGSKLSNLDYQYHQAMGAEDSFSALSPESKRILVKFGFDPAHPTIGVPPPTPLDTKKRKNPFSG